MRQFASTSVLLALSAFACSGGDKPVDPCPNGICTNDAAVPDDSNQGGEDASGCTESWQCTPWETNGTDDDGVRTCTDQNACGTTVNKPVETAVLPALDPEFYECNVEPIVAHGCAHLGCHGTEQGRAYRLYARGRLRRAGLTITEPGCLSAGQQYPSDDCIGSIECRCWTLPAFAGERRMSYDSARGFALDGAGNPLADMSRSELLEQPRVGGGHPHAGVFMWSLGDADYTTVKNWLEGATLGSNCNSGN